MGSVARTSYAPSESSLAPSRVAHIVSMWNFTTGGDVSASPAIVNGVVYIGSSDGYEYALNASGGSLLWKTYLGVDTHGNHNRGVASSATVVNGVVYVGAGNLSGQASVVALSAKSGTMLWNVSTGPVANGYFAWSSPLVVNGHLYIGVASKGDNPLVFGGLLEISIKSHHPLHFFNTTAPGGIGASIWSSPSYASSTNSVYVTTGNPGANGSALADSIVELNATSLTSVGHWTIPSNQTVLDGDFGATPVVYTPGDGTPLVQASNKNGLAYAWNQSAVGSGPVWALKISHASGSTGIPNLGPAGWSPGHLYIGSSATLLGGTNYSGSVRAVNDSTGKLLWQRPEPTGPVFGAPVFADGTLIVGAGSYLQLVRAATGAILMAVKVGGTIQGPVAVSHGEIVFGASNGVVYAFGSNSCQAGGSQATGAAASLSLVALRGAR